MDEMFSKFEEKLNDLKTSFTSYKTD